MINGNTTLSDLGLLLTGAGLTIGSVTRCGAQYVVRLDVAEAHRVDDKIRSAEGRGSTLAEAIEDARLGWVSYATRARRGAL